jgi:hypothetical protein
MEPIVIAAIAYGIVLTCSLAFFLYMFYRVSPRKMEERVQDLWTKIFTSNEKQYADMRNSMAHTVADYAAGYVVMLGEEFKKGNTGPLYNVVGPIFAAIRGLSTAVVEGAKGNIQKSLTVGMGNEKLMQLRGALPKKQQGWLDFLIVAKDIIGAPPSKQGGGNAPSTDLKKGQWRY